MPRFNVSLRVIENGSAVEQTISVEASGPRDARKKTVDKYGEVVIVAVGPELFLEHRQHRYAWSQERLDDGMYAAVEFTPVGPGARSGTAHRWKPRREAHFPTQAAAIACCQKWHDAAKTKDGTRAIEEQEQRAAVDALLNPSLGTCKNCGGQLHVDRERGGERFLACCGEDDGKPKLDHAEQGQMGGCGKAFPLPKRGTLRASGKACACGWPLIEVIPAWHGQRPWLQCVDNNCVELRDDWHVSSGPIAPH